LKGEYGPGREEMKGETTVRVKLREKGVNIPSSTSEKEE